MDKMYLLGLISGIVVAYFYDLVAQHQRRKRRERQRKASLANRL